MREILFRGKRIDNSEWTEGYLFKIWNRTFLLWGTTNDVPNMVEVIPETVSQFTGLTDKNGKKIFENGYMIIDNKTYKVIFDDAEYILTNIFYCDIITLKNNSIKGVFVDEI